MQVNRNLILRLDTRDHHVFANSAGLNDQLFHQFAANAFTLVIGMNVNRVFDGMTKTVKGAPVAK
ncbi:hypothetical protein D3C86_2084610 [compost metagenome]